MTSEAEGEIYVEEKILVIKKIHVRYTLRGCAEEKRDAAERAHSHHAARCPVARSRRSDICRSWKLRICCIHFLNEATTRLASMQVY